MSVDRWLDEAESYTEDAFNRMKTARRLLEQEGSSFLADKARGHETALQEQAASIQELRAAYKEEAGLLAPGDRVRFLLWHEGACGTVIDVDPRRRLQYVITVDDDEDTYAAKNGRCYGRDAVVLDEQAKCEWCRGNQELCDGSECQK